ncbi:hypothetical protein Cs7R123_44790 [Catellatospora sp. TT07R-123]|uniref:Hsp70 family protein n=1 Tax=Catellatospora sp. TT07R-123 TaxID=2733863 RepID=UPI001B13FE0D|nr:Hsp70 family protein [Catellatospora sp. TT07R-123]GHJ47137.1 hypothetical protein Cs7R123_44790 [Catellatospora sp. TT07R-123]
MTEWHLSIDFGTCYTTAATKSDGQPQLLEIENSRYLPSLVALDDSGTLLTGKAATQLAAQLPHQAERLPKRALVHDTAVRLGSRTVESTRLVAAVLRRVHEHALATYGGQAPATVRLTHPAAWGVEERAALGKAAQEAGISDPQYVAEPVAAAAYYAARDGLAADATVAVYDLGAGTLDTAVVGAPQGGFTVLAIGGDPGLGGEDLTDVLREVLAGHAYQRDPGPWRAIWSPDTDAARREQARVLRDVADAKEALSTATRVTLSVAGYPDTFLVQRPEYESAIEPLLRTSLDHLTDTVERAGLTVAQLSAVVLAGGASRTPRVSDLITHQLGVLPRTCPDPKAVVALGALCAEPPAPARPAPPRPGPVPRFFHVDRELD